jgi:hypothetical protein
MLFLKRPHAPNGIFKPVALKYSQQRQRFIVGFGLAEMLEQFCPAVFAGAILADSGKGCRDHLLVSFSVFSPISLQCGAAFAAVTLSLQHQSLYFFARGLAFG